MLCGNTAGRSSFCLFGSVDCSSCAKLSAIGLWSDWAEGGGLAGSLHMQSASDPVFWLAAGRCGAATRSDAGGAVGLMATAVNRVVWPSSTSAVPAYRTICAARGAASRAGRPRSAFLAVGLAINDCERGDERHTGDMSASKSRWAWWATRSRSGRR